MLIKLGTVFVLGAIEIWVSIPTGFALGLHPVTIALVSAIGGMAGATAVTLFGVRVREWIRRRRHKKKASKKESGMIKRIWDRYGVVGLGLLAPLITGAPAGTALGIALGAPRQRLLVWMNIGVFIWSVILTAAVALGVAGVGAVRH